MSGQQYSGNNQLFFQVIEKAAKEATTQASNEKIGKESAKGHLRSFIESGEVNPDFAINERGESGLHRAVRHGLYGITQLLIDNMGNLSQTDMWGYTPLAAAIKSGHNRCASQLINNMASVNEAQAPGGDTPLHLAFATPDCHVVSHLLIKGARVDTTNAFGNSPLHIVYPDEKSLEKVKFVLDSKPQAVNLKNKGGLTPLDKATQKGGVGLANFLKARGGVRGIAYSSSSRSNPTKAKRPRCESFGCEEEAYCEGELTQAFEKLSVTGSKQPRRDSDKTTETSPSLT